MKTLDILQTYSLLQTKQGGRLNLGSVEDLLRASQKVHALELRGS